MSNGTKLYVGDLLENVRKSELEKVFGKFGNLKDVWVAHNPPGFAFVNFASSREARKAVQALNGKNVCGSRIRVEVSKSKGPRSFNRRKSDRQDSPVRQSARSSYSTSRDGHHSSRTNYHSSPQLCRRRMSPSPTDHYVPSERLHQSQSLSRRYVSPSRPQKQNYSSGTESQSKRMRSSPPTSSMFRSVMSTLRYSQERYSSFDISPITSRQRTPPAAKSNRIISSQHRGLSSHHQIGGTLRDSSSSHKLGYYDVDSKESRPRSGYRESHLDEGKYSSSLSWSRNTEPPSHYTSSQPIQYRSRSPLPQRRRSPPSQPATSSSRSLGYSMRESRGQTSSKELKSTRNQKDYRTNYSSARGFRETGRM